MSVSLEAIGLTTFIAMKKLVDQIEFELNNCKCSSHGFYGFKIWLKESFSHRSVSSTFSWPSVLLLFTCSTAFFVASVYKNDNYLLNESIFLYFILVSNIILVGFETKLKHQEIHTKTSLLASKIRNSLLKNESIIEEWKTGKYYPHLHLQSPCISLQWTFRDNMQINLPTSLLVKGDVILLCPGHAAPAHCQIINESTFANHTSKHEATSFKTEHKIIELKKGEFYAPNQEQNFPSFNNPRLRKSAIPMKFRLLETPIIPLLRLTLDKSTSRPVTSYEKERYAITVKYVEHIIAPVLLIISLLISLTHYLFLTNESYEIDFDKKNLEWILLRPAMIIIPILPLLSPVSWILLNAFGYAKLYLAAKQEEDRHKTNKPLLNGQQWCPGHNLGSPDSKTKMNVCGDLDYELDGNSVQSIIDENETTFCSNKKQLLSTMKKLLLDQDENLWRSANLLQVFGSITALSCVDKKGILSTPIPNADKVFFLNSTASDDQNHKSPDKTNAEKGSQDLIDLAGSNSNLVESNNNLHSTNDLNNITNEFKSRKLNKKQSSVKKKSNRYCTKVEVLDVTPDRKNGLQFDDPDWQRYLPNLKPLGLAILLNTCNTDTQDEYSQFTNHISQESLLVDTKLPVVSKRCLCEFAKQIGFTSAATNDYNYLFQIFSYRHIKPEVIQEGKLAKSLNLKRLKMPFPNMSSALIKDTYSNSNFLFTQGTCDLILDTTSEFWDGEDLCLLSEADKKHILDFYHRTSLTANCVAFSYSPAEVTNLTKSLEKNNIEDRYFIEFPPDSSHLFKSQKNPKSHNDNEQKTLQSHHLSTDSLVMKDVKDANDEKERPHSSLSSHSADGQNLDLDLVLKQLCNQVFIGMVTMQYHACSDFVQLVETLQKACVRFVHFSKENELRSRTFSEKMGLESGWNSHISLLSEQAMHCENPNCRIMNCNGTLCAFKSQLKKPLAMNMSDHSNVNYSSLNLQRSQSAPSAVNSLDEIRNDQFDLDLDCNNYSTAQRFDKRPSNAHESNVKERSLNASEESIADKEDKRQTDGSKQLLTNSPGSSRFSDSINDKSTAPIAFDISNRAKLPKGIENIRPHLENVDNVPLLVSLFTDCTPDTTSEMIKIMQEYGEVVCLIGSSSNLSNIPVFLQGDTSIGIQPLYPQVCVQAPVTESNGEIPFKEFISPIDLSRELISLPCAFSIQREDVVSLSKLICYCRNYCLNARNYIQFYVSCCLSLALAQFCTSLLLLPPLLSTGHILWCCCFVIPVLSYSLMGAELNDPKVMNLAMGKNLNLIMSKSSILYFLLCYLLKFSISAIIVVFNFAILIYNYNELPESNLGSKKYFFMIDTKEEILNNFDTWSFYLFFCQTFSVFFFVLYFVFISLGFVYRASLLWQKSPLNNKFWFATSIFIMFIHFIFSLSIIQIFRPSNVNLNRYLSSIPTFISIIALIWPLPLISLNSLVKKRELKIYGRQQRRARLEFNTKLGMNSPW